MRKTRTIYFNRFDLRCTGGGEDECVGGMPSRSRTPHAFLKTLNIRKSDNKML